MNPTGTADAATARSWREPPGPLTPLFTHEADRTAGPPFSKENLFSAIYGANPAMVPGGDIRAWQRFVNQFTATGTRREPNDYPWLWACPSWYEHMAVLSRMVTSVAGGANLRRFARLHGDWDTQGAMACTLSMLDGRNGVRATRYSTPAAALLLETIRTDVEAGAGLHPDPAGPDGSDWIGWWENDTDEGRALRTKWWMIRQRRLGDIGPWALPARLAFDCPFLTARDAIGWIRYATQSGAPIDGAEGGVESLAHAWRYAGVTDGAWLWAAAGYSPAEAQTLLSPNNPNPAPSNDELATLAAMRGIHPATPLIT